MGFPFKQFFGALTNLAPVVLLLVPGGDKLAPFVPVVVKAVSDAEKDPGASGSDKRAYVQTQVANAAAITNQARPGTVDEMVVVEAAGHYVDAIIGTINAVVAVTTKAKAALPNAPAIVDTTHPA